MKRFELNSFDNVEDIVYGTDYSIDDSINKGLESEEEEIDKLFNASLKESCDEDGECEDDGIPDNDEEEEAVDDEDIDEEDREAIEDIDTDAVDYMVNKENASDSCIDLIMDHDIDDNMIDAVDDEDIDEEDALDEELYEESGLYGLNLFDDIY